MNMAPYVYTAEQCTWKLDIVWVSKVAAIDQVLFLLFCAFLGGFSACMNKGIGFPRQAALRSPPAAKLELVSFRRTAACSARDIGCRWLCGQVNDKARV